MRVLLLGREPDRNLGHTYVREGEYDGVVIGSLTLGEYLRFGDSRALEALAQGKPVLLYTPGLPDPGKSRGLAAAMASTKRELMAWGITFTDGGGKRLVTAQAARLLRQQGRGPEPGAVLTPLAREILEGKA